MSAVRDVKPELLVEKTDAEFSQTDTLYNDENVTYNDPSQVYGGSDRKQSLGQAPSAIVDIKPAV